MTVPSRKAAENQYACVACDASYSNMCLSIVVDQYSTVQCNFIVSVEKNLLSGSSFTFKKNQYS